MSIDLYFALGKLEDRIVALESAIEEIRKRVAQLESSNPGTVPR
jgi:hypothetical protein